MPVVAIIPTLPVFVKFPIISDVGRITPKTLLSGFILARRPVLLDRTQRLRGCGVTGKYYEWTSFFEKPLYAFERI